MTLDASHLFVELLGSIFFWPIMMFHATALIGISIGYYGLSVGTGLRKDITIDYVRLSAEIAKYAGEGAKIMIDHGWMEEPPQAVNRDQLPQKKSKFYQNG